MLNLYPDRYDDGGWYNLLNRLSQAGVDISGITDLSTLPKSKKDTVAKVTAYKQEIAKPTNFTFVTGIDADNFFAIGEDKRSKEFEHFIITTEQLYFPPYMVELDPIVQKYIAENFMYTFGKDGSPIIYSRALNAPGTIWEECGDSECVFPKVRGALREGLLKRLVIRSKARTVTVFNKTKDDVNIYEHVPYWKLHRKYFPNAMETVKGSPENVQKFAEQYNAWIDNMKRCNAGSLNSSEIERGMQELPKKLRELDDSILDMTFFYRDDITLPELTNDPAEPARSYFDLSSISDGPTPDFDGFMESIHPACRDSLMAAIYATFFAKCKLNQYIWIHGEGGDGKSSLLSAIAKYAGDRLACSLSAQDMKSDFGLENTVGKRMVIMSDVKTGLTIKSSLIHNLTGHDLVSINRKNKPVISVRLNPILWIAANDAPDVNFDNRNEARRCLYIKMIEPPLEIQKKFYFMKPDGTFEVDEDGQKQNNGYDLEGHLVEEMPHILFKCREAFNRVCPAPYSVIKQNSNAIHIAKENCLDIDAATFNTYIKETFSFTNKDAKMLQTEIFEAVAETMRNHSDKTQLNQFTKRDIRRLLTVKYGCERKKIDGIYYMTGLMRKFDNMEPIQNPATGRPVYTPMDAPANDGDLI